MQGTSERTAKSIRMNEDLYHQARVAAVVARKSLGQWLEEAIYEKLSRERLSTVADAETKPLR